MSFVQRKLVKSFNQTRGIYDVFEYKPDNGDSLEDMLADGYFDQSRYFSDPDWNGGIIKAVDASGYEAMIVVDASGTPVTSTLQKIKNQSYDISRYEIVDSLAALPKPVGNVITLEAGKAYKIVGDVDLMGNRLVASGNVAIKGTSSETSSLTSTGLDPSEYLITTDYSLPMRNITVKDVGRAIGVNLLGAGATADLALDWTAVNFSGCNVNVRLGDLSNFIMTDCAVLGSGTIDFFGEIGTLGISNSIFIGDGSAYSIFNVEATATITRRFRMIYSAIVAFGSTNAINFSTSATIPNEGYILDTVNFSGGGTYLVGVDHTDNKALFAKNVGIENSADVSQYYMNGNSTATVIASTGAPVKVAGTTTSSMVTSKFVNTDNRATYQGALTQYYRVVATLSLTSGNGHQIGAYIAKNGTVIPESEVYGTTGASGRAENITVQSLVQIENGDFIEIFVENNTATQNIVVTDLNVTIQ